MKKLVLCFLVSASMIACNSKQNETTSNTDDAAMADFKENSKITAKYQIKNLAAIICEVQLFYKVIFKNI